MYDPGSRHNPGSHDLFDTSAATWDQETRQDYSGKELIPRRIVARLLDEIIAGILFISLVLFTFFVVRVSGGGLPVIIPLMTIVALSNPAYFFVFERFRGQTPMKMLFGLQVSTEYHERISTKRLLLRSFLNFLFVGNWLSLVELTVMFVRSDGRRLVDMITGTWVISRKAHVGNLTRIDEAI